MKTTKNYFAENKFIPNVQFIRDWFDSISTKESINDAIFKYIDDEDCDSLKQSLTKDPSIIYRRDSESRTPLMYAAFLGNKNAVDLLIGAVKKEEQFAYIAAISAPFNWNALYYAIFGGNKEIFNTLNKITQHDLNPYRDIFNWSPFDYLMLNEDLYFKLNTDEDIKKWEMFQLYNSYASISNATKFCIAGIVSNQPSMKFNLKKSYLNAGENWGNCIGYWKIKVPHINVGENPQYILHLLDKYNYIYHYVYSPYSIAMYSGNLKIAADLFESMRKQNGNIDFLISLYNRMGELAWQDEKTKKYEPFYKEKYGEDIDELIVKARGYQTDEIITPQDIKDLFG